MEPERLQQIVRYANSAVIDRLLAKKSLHEFIKQGWRTVEPGDYVDGWHIGIICDHLEAVHRGEIKRLMINMPPDRKITRLNSSHSLLSRMPSSA